MILCVICRRPAACVGIYFRDRVNRYVKEYRAGVRLRAICKPCNSLDGNRRRWAAARRRAA